MIFLVKGTSSLLPLVLREVVDSIICVPDPKKNIECRSEREVYILIGIYAVTKFMADFFNYIREVPYQHMASKAEISIAHDVYDHIQRQSLDFHLNRETGIIIRTVSRGSQNFATVLRMCLFNMIPLFTETTIVLVIYATLFHWYFCVF